MLKAWGSKCLLSLLMCDITGAFMLRIDLLQVIWCVHEAQTPSISLQACWLGASKPQMEGIAVARVFRRGYFESAETEGEEENAAVLDTYNNPCQSPTNLSSAYSPNTSTLATEYCLPCVSADTSLGSTKEDVLQHWWCGALLSLPHLESGDSQVSAIVRMYLLPSACKALVQACHIEKITLSTATLIWQTRASSEQIHPEVRGPCVVAGATLTPVGYLHVQSDVPRQYPLCWLSSLKTEEWEWMRERESTGKCYFITTFKAASQGKENNEENFSRDMRNKCPRFGKDPQGSKEAHTTDNSPEIWKL